METRAGSPVSFFSHVDASALRARAPHVARPRVHYTKAVQPHAAPEAALKRRVVQFQRRWESIKEDLPPQLSRRHIGMISIGGVIGTGLFLGSGAALQNGGPVGAFLGYFIIGTLVYCLCVSIGEMIAFLPNVGGVVGLADLYVDSAVGFSLGWAAWYNWSVTLPTEITAAAILMKFWRPHISVGLISGCFLIGATTINCFSPGVYGEFEFWLSSLKVITIISIILISLVLDLGAGKQGFIGFKHWSTPFAQDYLGVTGPLGQFLGFWAVLMQAAFSFFGSEVPGIAAGEVIDATRNVPRALQRVWIRITLFYLGGVFFAGLLVDRNAAASTDDNTVNSSPFVIAFRQAGLGSLAHAINAAVLISAWSAAASDIYIGSRFLFFLARRGHAPRFFAVLTRYPPVEREEGEDEEGEEEDGDEDDDDDSEHDLPHVIDINHAASYESPSSFSEDFEASVSDVWGSYDKNSRSPSDAGGMLPPGLSELSPHAHAGETMPILTASGSDSGSGSGSEGDRTPDPNASPVEPAIRTRRRAREDAHRRREHDVEANASRKRGQPLFVLPLRAIFATASVGLLCFLGATSGGGPEVAFNWLVAVASIASLQSWAGMLYTYIRWHKGTVYAENKYRHAQDGDEQAKEAMKNIAIIKKHRHWGQPYLARYAFAVCLIILITNGWSVFLHNGWRISNIPGEDLTQYTDSQKQSAPVSQFLSSYVPLPFFLLLTFGYKLIYRTEMVPVEKMDFSRGNVPPQTQEPTSERLLDRILGWLLII